MKKAFVVPTTVTDPVASSSLKVQKIAAFNLTEEAARLPDIYCASSLQLCSCESLHGAQQGAQDHTRPPIFS